MIKKLRLKFILLSMLSLLLVLLVIMGSINLLSLRSLTADTDSLLKLLADNRGSFPKPDDPHGDFPKKLSPEAPYETRFFSVLLAENGSLLTVDTGRIAAVDTEAAIDYAEQVYSAGRTSGFLNDYRYLRQTEGTNVRIVFLDCSRNLTTWRSFLLTSCLISIFGLLAVLLLIILFSGRIIRPVAESFEKQKRFITDAGHEIKTPLSVIDADAAVLELETGENEWLRDIQKQTQRLADLTNDLICLSRMEEDEKQWQMLDFSLSDAVSETAQSFHALAITQDKSFTCTVTPLLTLCGDEKAIRQLCSILLDNALKYSPASSEIAVSLEKQGKLLRLTVTNATNGLSAESLPHLFDRFYRADPSRSSQIGGYGIGLSIAKAIVQAHKGKIFAVSPTADTLQMTVLLPL